MTNIHQMTRNALSAVVGIMLLAGPALAISAIQAEGRGDKISGAGLVLMVSLQRM